MSYARKNSKNVLGSVVLLIAVAAIAAWQFHKYVTFTDASGALNIQGGSAHLWFAIILTAFACGIAFLVFSVFLHHDKDDELHITFAPTPRHLNPEVDRK